MVVMKVLLLALLALVFAPAASPSSTQARARISIVDEAPLVVRGVGFKASERVTVTVTHAKALFRRVAVAGPAGVVIARWTRALPTTCGSTTVTARGSMGTRVVVKWVANDCAPGPVDPKESSIDPPTQPIDPPTYPIDPQPKQSGPAEPKDMPIDPPIDQLYPIDPQPKQP
jgi:hypothetical protein